MVKVFGATTFKSGWIEDKDKAGNTFFINLQSANLALDIAFVAGSRYLIMDGKSNHA